MAAVFFLATGFFAAAAFGARFAVVFFRPALLAVARPDAVCFAGFFLGAAVAADVFFRAVAFFEDDARPAALRPVPVDLAAVFFLLEVFFAALMEAGR